jgi:hypothetical protein
MRPLDTAAAEADLAQYDMHLLCRLSDAESKDGQSLESQVLEAKRAAAAVLGAPLDHVDFVEAGQPGFARASFGRPVVKVSACNISGEAPWELRRDLQELVADAEAGRCKAILSSNLDRLARNPEVAHRLRRELLAAGVRTVYEGLVPYDLRDDNQTFMYGIRAEFAAYERALITRRMYSGHIRAAREGFYVGGNIPFGTTLEPTGLRSKSRRYRMVVDKDEMGVARELFARRDLGWSLEALAAWTVAAGVMPNPWHFRSPGPGLLRSHIERILKNPFYVTGHYLFNVKATRWAPEVVEQEIDIGEGVPHDLFDRLSAQRRVKTGVRQGEGFYLLTGLVFHRESGRPFKSTTTKVTPTRRVFYYYSREWGVARRRLVSAGELDASALIPPGGCKPVYANIQRGQLEGVVLRELSALADHPALIAELVSADEDRRAAERLAVDDEDHYRKLAELNQAQASLDRLVDAFAAGTLAVTPSTSRKHQALEAEVQRLEVETKPLSTRRRAARPMPDRSDAIREGLAALPDRLALADGLQRRALIRALVHRVWVDTLGTVSIELALG